MIFSWFHRKPSPIPGLLHEKIVAAARAPGLYAGYGVPDTVEGRLEMLIIHLFLFMRRTSRDADLADLAQDVTDRAFRELDRALRESGVGDMSIPKKMKKLAGLVYGHLAAYAGPVETRNTMALSETVDRLVFDGLGQGLSGRIAGYILDADRHLAGNVTADALLRGDITFPEPAVRGASA